MDLLDRLLQHDAFATRLLIDRCAQLPDADLDREFDIGKRTARATLDHIIANMEIWAALMNEAIASAPLDPFTKPSTAPRPSSIEDLRARLDDAASLLAEVATSVRDVTGWDDTWLDTLDKPPTRKTYGGAIAHILTHSMHHRAQLLHILKQLGQTDLPEGDVFSWENS